ncbi:TPM domain-containing protein [Bacillus massiliglaciei]|uniref:TPM domain-containing protein n=1 Tax=Bacillus massiliglaciei TaxID=1816693 RepID=UPI000AAED044|nr:TPM domain-containing protein [Bacillus massiliglaciei]
MISRKISSWLLLILLLAMTGRAFAANQEIPAPVGDIYVQDFASVLTQSEKEELNRMGRQTEDQTSAQIAILTVQTTGERPIQEFANEAFRTYGIGNKEKNNGVLLVVAMKDQKTWLEVGYGMEGRIPDGKAGRILDEYTIPYLEAGQPEQALKETYKVLVSEATAEYSGDSQPGQNQGGEGIGIPAWLLIVLIIAVVFLDIKFFGGTLSYLLISLFSRGGGGGGSGPRGGGGGSSGGGGAGRGW